MVCGVKVFVLQGTLGTAASDELGLEYPDYDVDEEAEEETKYLTEYGVGTTEKVSASLLSGASRCTGSAVLDTSRLTMCWGSTNRADRVQTRDMTLMILQMRHEQWTVCEWHLSTWQGVQISMKGEENTRR